MTGGGLGYNSVCLMNTVEEWREEEKSE